MKGKQPFWPDNLSMRYIKPVTAANRPARQPGAARKRRDAATARGARLGHWPWLAALRTGRQTAFAERRIGRRTALVAYSKQRPVRPDVNRIAGKR